MPADAPAPEIAVPFSEPPGPGTAQEVAPGILWLRFALPFLLNHVNVYLLEDEDGWAAFDTGLGNSATRAAWDAVLAGPLSGRRITRVVCSHFHPDHVGLVGWLAQRFGCPLFMPRTEMLMTRMLEHGAPAASGPFYAERGLTLDAAVRVAVEGHDYLRMITGLPAEYQRITAGDTLRIGGRDWAVFTGGGHAPEQAMLHCASDGVFLAADQVLPRISPNISVQPMEPEADPLGEYLLSLAELERHVPEGALVLPGHHVPFTGLPTRAAELVPVLFKRQMDSHQTGFAFGETLAHVNYMRARGELVQARGADGVLRVHAA